MKEEIVSVGIDIGTSTTQLVFSKISIDNLASMISVPSYKITHKEIFYRSNIYLTPLLSQSQIDASGIRKIIEEEYLRAGIKPGEVETGAIIITGETARKENAAQVLAYLSDLAGDFVVATAGPDLEGIIAGKGAGACKYSKENNCITANLDIGGGTTNIAVFRYGEVIDTACLDIGGRLIQYEENTQRVQYISKKMEILIQSLGLDIYIGKILSIKEIEIIVGAMVQILEEAIGIKTGEPGSLLPPMLTNHGLKLSYTIDTISFSGGVADCIWSHLDKNLYKYGDIGVFLGRAINNGDVMKGNVIRPDETIAATVVGAGAHSMEISGSTITFEEQILPLKNVPILKLTNEEEFQSHDKMQKIIAEKLKWYQVEAGGNTVALALQGKENPRFADIVSLADAIISGMHMVLEMKLPLVVVVERDMAKVLGQTLNRKLGFKKNVVCIDSIQMENGDYMDIGHSVASGKVLPVIVKNLLFNY